MRFPRILSQIRSARWAVRPATLQAIVDTLGAHLRGGVGPGVIQKAATPPPASAGPAAIVPIYGIIGKHLSALETECGGCDVDAVGAAIDAATSNPAAQLVVLDFASPGGTVTGVTELASKIRAATASKPVVAFTSDQACSAAYWLASACDAVFCAPSAEVGSVGVYVAMVDDSEWFKKEGYKLELIKAGAFKAAGISGQPLAKDERALIQADVDAIYAMFVADVRRGRGNVADATLQGQSFRGALAVKAGLVDGLANDLDDLLTGDALPAILDRKGKLSAAKVSPAAAMTAAASPKAADRAPASTGGPAAFLAEIDRATGAASGNPEAGEAAYAELIAAHGRCDTTAWPTGPRTLHGFVAQMAKHPASKVRFAAVRALNQIRAARLAMVGPV